MRITLRSPESNKNESNKTSVSPRRRLALRAAKISSALLLLWLASIYAPLACFDLATQFSNRGVARASDTSVDATPEKLLEIGGFAPDENALQARNNKSLERVKIVSYNIRFRSGEDLQQLIKLLKEDSQLGGADIIGLQEVDRNRRRTNNQNTVRQIAEALQMNYVWAAPPATNINDEEETGVAILSPFPLADVERIVLPQPGPGGRRRAAIGATARLNKDKSVRVYSIHAETRIDVDEKIEQYSAILASLKKHPHATHTVIVGDFNSIGGKAVTETNRLFTNANFTTPFPMDKTTWKRVFLKFKLDWVWLRGFGAVRNYGIRRDVTLSDHFPLWAEVEL